MNHPSYSNIEKRQAVLTLLTHPQWQKKSNREIARQCGVSLDLVNRLRKVAQPSERYVQMQKFTSTPQTLKKQGFPLKNTVDLSERIVQIQNFETTTPSPSAERLVRRKGKAYRMKIGGIGKSKRTFAVTASAEEDSGPTAS